MIELFELTKDVARKAGKAVLMHYNSSFGVSYKDDLQPLTEADLASEKVIIQGLDAFGHQERTF